MPLFKDTPAGPSGTFARRIVKAGKTKPSMPIAREFQRHEERMPREPVYANATLVISSSKIAAVVTNLNAAGARVEFTTYNKLPGEVVIVAPMLGLNNRRARVVWQESGSAGLLFVNAQ